MAIIVTTYQASGALNNQSTVIPGAGDNNEGVVSLNQVRNVGGVPADKVVYDNAASGSFATTVQEALDEALGVPGQLLEFFVSPTGDDANTGTSAADPFLTVQRAERALPLGWKGITRIICDPGTYDLTAGGSVEAGFANLFANAPGGAPGQAFPLQIVGAFTDEIGTQTTTAADATEMTLTNAGMALTPGAFIGAFVSITSGPNAGQRRMIAANTATALLVNSALLPGTSVIGVDFIIEKPAVIFQFDNLNFVSLAMEWKGIKLQQVAPGGLGFSGVFFFSEGIEIELLAFQSLGIENHWRGQSFGVGPGLFDLALRGPAGVYLHTAPGGAAFVNCSEPLGAMLSFWVLQNMFITNQARGQVVLDDLAAYNTTILTQGQAFVRLSSTNPPTPAPFAKASGSFMLEGVPIVLGANPPINIVAAGCAGVFDNINLSGAASLSGATIEDGSFATFGLVTGANAVVGIDAGRGSSVAIDFTLGHGLTSVTGGFLGNTLVSGVPATYVQIRAVPPAWAPGTPYAVGAKVTLAPGGPLLWYYQAVTGGVSGGAPPIASTNPGGFFLDGTVVWQNVQKGVNVGQNVIEVDSQFP